jgi:hypothetical protein
VSGEYRLILNLSYPPEKWVSEFIDKEYCTVRYASIDDAVRMVQKLGKGARLAKADIKSAFGGDKKEPEIRPREISFESFSLTGFPFCKTLFELEHEVGILGPVFSSLQPNFKPSFNSCLVLKSSRQFSIIIVFKGE